MTNIFLMDSDKEATVESIKDPEELYDKTHKLFKTKSGKILCGNPSPTDINSLYRSARHGLSFKGLHMGS